MKRPIWQADYRYSSIKWGAVYINKQEMMSQAAFIADTIVVSIAGEFLLTAIHVDTCTHQNDSIE